jgi:hypothetical protein
MGTRPGLVAHHGENFGMQERSWFSVLLLPSLREKAP